MKIRLLQIPPDAVARAKMLEALQRSERDAQTQPVDSHTNPDVLEPPPRSVRGQNDTGVPDQFPAGGTPVHP